MADGSHKPTIHWYRCSVSREDLARLNKRSNLKAAFQTCGYLGLLAVTGTAAAVAAGRIHWSLVLVLLFVHGTGYAFIINGFHELVHDSVFKTRFLNRFFLRIFSFLGWHNHIGFWASHTEHHKYTLHPPADLEVVLPAKLTLRGFLTSAIVDPRRFYDVLKDNIRISRNRLEGEWEKHLFETVVPQQRRRYVNWARFVLVGHAAIVVVSLALGWWMVPIVVTLAHCYGSALQWLCNNTQHIGLQDDVEDFRLCTRTILLNPLFQFLYWHMNFHIEHHMYAAVPCYNLGKLHRLVRHDLPVSSRGLLATWRHISAIQRRQRDDPDYQYVPELPSPATNDGTAIRIDVGRVQS